MGGTGRGGDRGMAAPPEGQLRGLLSKSLFAGCGAGQASGSCEDITRDGAARGAPSDTWSCAMRIESDGHSQGNPRLYELVEHAPKTGKSPTVWAWPELMDYLKIAGQPVAGPWPPHQEPRPDPDYESLPVAVPDPESGPRTRSGPEADPQTWPDPESGTGTRPDAGSRPGTRSDAESGPAAQS